MRLIPLPMKLQHIVFPDQCGRRSAVNLAGSIDPPLPVIPCRRLDDLPAEKVAFFETLFRIRGLDWRAYRPETLERRLPACLRALRAATPAQACRILERAPHLADGALSAMLVGVTSFFRDPSVFEQLRKEVLPSLARGKDGIYAWSVGTSDGAEIYSLAITLAEMGIFRSSYLLGTDCRPDAIERAKTASYDDVSMAGVCPYLREKYFLKNAGSWVVSPSLRHGLRWRVSNILHECEAGLWDLIIFRNTAMYLRSEAALRVMRRLEGSLRPGGAIILGKAERPGTDRLSFLGPCIYRRSW